MKIRNVLNTTSILDTMLVDPSHLYTDVQNIQTNSHVARVN
jgi:hypothetical protein